MFRLELQYPKPKQLIVRRSTACFLIASRREISAVFFLSLLLPVIASLVSQSMVAGGLVFLLCLPGFALAKADNFRLLWSPLLVDGATKSVRHADVALDSAESIDSVRVFRVKTGRKPAKFHYLIQLVTNSEKQTVYKIIERETAVLVGESVATLLEKPLHYCHFGRK